MEADRETALAAGSSAVCHAPNLVPLVPEIPDHKLLCLIGRGAYGEVWMARNAIGTLRAVKVVQRRSFQRTEYFEREFNGLLKFEPISRSHDGLVDVLQIGRRDDAGYFYYIMELADDAGGESEKVNPELSRTLLSRPSSSPNYTPRTLRAELQARGSLPPDECIAIGLKLSSALANLHTNGLVHRDIKPSNIIFVNDEPKLADIGLVTAIDDAQSLVGTAGYIPPEGPGTPKADIYSLGKVLYEITFGKDRQDFPQVAPELQSHPDYPELLELNEVILKACETDPSRRYQSAEEIQADLALLQRGKSVKQKRRQDRGWIIAKKVGLTGMAAAILVAALSFLGESKRVHTPTPDARREYEVGKLHYNQFTPKAHKKAMEHLSKAVELDPEFILPYRELIALHVWGRGALFASQEEKMHSTKEIADYLLAVNPNLAEGHAALSYWNYLKQDWRGAEEEIVRAIKLDPNYAIARDIYAYYLSLLGRADEAQAQVERSQALDPAARTSTLVAAWPYFAARRFDKAIEQVQRVIELDVNFPEAYNFLGRCYEAQSNYSAAIEAWKTYDLMVGHDASRVNTSYTALRQAFDANGEQGYLRKYIELIHENESLPEDERIFSVHDIAGYYARLGDKENALNEIERLLESGDLLVRVQLKFEPMYDMLHDDSRFKALLKKAGFEN